MYVKLSKMNLLRGYCKQGRSCRQTIVIAEGSSVGEGDTTLLLCTPRSVDMTEEMETGHMSQTLL